jgi:hypothetical protein
LSHGASLNKVRMRAARPAFAIHMAWHNRNRGDAAQRWVRERLAASARAVWRFGHP